MARSLPTIQSLTLAATVGLFALTSALTAQPPVPGSPPIRPEDLKANQDENARLYRRLADEMLRLAQRWEKSDNPDEKERAKTLRTALEIAALKGVDNLFKELVSGLAGRPTGGDLNRLIGQDQKLRAALEEILRTLETEGEAARLAREIAELKELIRKIEQIKREQEDLRARTENPRSDPNNLAKEQGNLAKQTEAVAKSFPGQDKKDPQGGNAGPGSADDKSEPKPDVKPADARPESKPETPDDKSQGKPDGSGSPMSSDQSPSGKSGGEPKPSPKGDTPAGDAKESPMGNAGGEPKPGGEPRPMATGEPKDPANPMNGGQQDQQKPSPGDSKAAGEGKAQQKPSEGQQGGDGKPMPGGMPMAGGQPSQSKPSQSQGGGSPPMGGGSPPMGGQQPPRPNDPAQENVEQAVPQQQGAQEDIKKGQKDEASKKQDEAIKRLEQAIKELEKRLKQLREKELAQLLANLEERVGRMLRMQIEVYEETKKINDSVVRAKQKTTAHIQKSQAEADKELAIVAEAEKALKLMEGEGSAVVFAGVLSQVKGDMEAVHKRLNEGRVEGRGKDDQAEGTQLIEEDIIEQLTMMKEALKKAKQDLENQQSGPPKDGNSGGKPNNKLLDLINELKLIKMQQEQVNKRTISYSKQDPGEQAKDPLIQAELKQLGERQRILQEMLHKIATQANQ